MIRNAASLCVLVFFVFAVASCSKSNNISFTNEPSIISILTPVNNATRDGMIDVKVDAADQEGIGKVALYVNNKLIGESIAEPYNFRLDMSTVATGATASIVARVIDVFGAVTNSTPVTVTRGIVAPPVINFSSPATGATAKQGDAITFTATATDPKDGTLDPKNFTWNSSLQGDFALPSNGQFKGLVIGTHLITVTATNSSGVPESKSVTVTVQANTGQYAYIPAGTYYIGQPVFMKSRVTLTRSILMDKYEFTIKEMLQAQSIVLGGDSKMWSGFAKTRNDDLKGLKTSPYYYPPIYDVKDQKTPIADDAVYPNYPSVFIYYYDALLACNAFSKRDGLTPVYTLTNSATPPVPQTKASSIRRYSYDLTANGWRLPTEAEWEVAARGGLVGKKFPWGDDMLLGNANTLSDLNLTNPLVMFQDRGPVEVGSYSPNAYGLYDMAGNASEMVMDMYTGALPSGTDPVGFDASKTPRFVTKGGSWTGFLDLTQIGIRNITIPQATTGNYDSFSDNVGFRIVRNAP
jgi:formylglycine-generating enzyme required for sulfatase activity